MKYEDLFTPPHGETREPKQQCLIWSENHEHAVASIDDEIHPQAKCVWIGFEDTRLVFTSCYLCLRKALEDRQLGAC